MSKRKVLSATGASILGFYSMASPVMKSLDNYRTMSKIPQVKKYYEIQNELNGQIPATGRDVLNQSLDLTSLVKHYKEIEQERLTLTQQENFDSLRSVYDDAFKSSQSFDGYSFFFGLAFTLFGLTYLGVRGIKGLTKYIDKIAFKSS